MHAHVHTHMHAHTHMHMHTHTHMHAQMYTHMHGHTHNTHIPVIIRTIVERKAMMIPVVALKEEKNHLNSILSSLNLCKDPTSLPAVTTSLCP